MEDWLLAVVLGMGIPTGIFAFLAGFIALLYSIFARISRWNALAHRYKVITEPGGGKFTQQTIKVGSVRWRRCVTVILAREGMYLQLGRQTGLLAIRKHPPVLIPWAEFKAPSKGRLYLGWEAVQLSIGEPEMAAITFPIGLYKEMIGYLN